MNWNRLKTVRLTINLNDSVTQQEQSRSRVALSVNCSGATLQVLVVPQRPVAQVLAVWVALVAV